MEINPSPQPANRITLVSTPVEIRGWQTGQMLQAVAANNSQNGQVTLLIGRLTLEARTPLPIQSGQTLALEVVSRGEVPVLRVVTELSGKAVIEQAIRQELPRQASQNTLLANLTSLTQQGPAAQKEPLPATILQAIRSFLRQLPEPKQVSTADGLRRSLHNSGGFLESRLANPTARGQDLHQDLKGALLRLEQQLKESYRSLVRPSGAPPAPPRQGGAGIPAGTPMPARGAEAMTTGAPREAAAPATEQARLAASAIREALPPQTATTPPAENRPAAQGSAGGLPGNNPSAPPGQAGATTTTTGVTPEALLRTVPVAREFAPPLRHGPLQVQARAEATLTRQDNLSHILTTLLKDTDSSLARMQLSQLGSQAVDGEQRQVWLLELPVRKEDGVDLFQFRIERETGHKAAEAPEQDRWTVRFVFSLQGLGPVYARISILGDSVSTTIWIEDEASAQLFNRHRETLEQNLLRAGLVIEQFAFINGKPENDIGFSGRPSQQILNEKA